QAKSKARVKNFEELYADHKNWMDTNRDPMAILIPITRKLGSKVLTAKGITKSFGDREVLKGVNFDLPPGAVMGVIGPNGTGKTTLLKIIAGQMQPDGGDIEMGPTVDLCYVDQDRADLDPNKNVWEEISGGADEISLGKLKINSRAYVSKFNFRGPEQQQLVGTLSGGQRNRVQLAKMLKVGGNLLLVDEPT
ncbi:MAG: ATP-binding cassette domain-containing protein, partial [Anaerolineae bacterium]|nr:ATP-binding cassette domain-containing protein [Anaerolineae bacterium]